MKLNRQVLPVLFFNIRYTERVTVGERGLDLLLLFRQVENEGRGTQRDDGPVVKTQPVVRPEDFVHQERAAEALVVAQRANVFASRLAAHVDVAVPAVHAGVIRVDGNVHVSTFVAPSDEIVTLGQRQCLAISKRVLDNGQIG